MAKALTDCSAGLFFRYQRFDETEDHDDDVGAQYDDDDDDDDDAPFSGAADSWPETHLPFRVLMKEFSASAMPTQTPPTYVNHGAALEGTDDPWDDEVSLIDKKTTRRGASYDFSYLVAPTIILECNSNSNTSIANVNAKQSFATTFSEEPFIAAPECQEPDSTAGSSEMNDAPRNDTSSLLFHDITSTSITEEQDERDRERHDHRHGEEEVTVPLLSSYQDIRDHPSQPHSSSCGCLDFSSIMLTELHGTAATNDDAATTTSSFFHQGSDAPAQARRAPIHVGKKRDDIRVLPCSPPLTPTASTNKVVVAADAGMGVFPEEKKDDDDTMLGGDAPCWCPPSLLLANSAADDRGTVSKSFTHRQGPVVISAEKHEDMESGGGWKHDHEVDAQLSLVHYDGDFCATHDLDDSVMEEATIDCTAIVEKTNSMMMPEKNSILAAQTVPLESTSSAAILTVQELELSVLPAPSSLDVFDEDCATEKPVPPRNTNNRDPKKFKTRERRKRDSALKKTAPEASFLCSLRTFSERKGRLDDARPERSLGVPPRKKDLKKEAREEAINMSSRLLEDMSSSGLLESPTSVVGPEETRIHPFLPAGATCLDATSSRVEPLLNHHWRGEHTNSRTSSEHILSTPPQSVQRSSLLSLHQQLFLSTTPQGNDIPVPFLPYPEDSYQESGITRPLSNLLDTISSKSTTTSQEDCRGIVAGMDQEDLEDIEPLRPCIPDDCDEKLSLRIQDHPEVLDYDTAGGINQEDAEITYFLPNPVAWDAESFASENGGADIMFPDVSSFAIHDAATVVNSVIVGNDQKTKASLEFPPSYPAELEFPPSYPAEAGHQKASPTPATEWVNLQFQRGIQNSLGVLDTDEDQSMVSFLVDRDDNTLPTSDSADVDELDELGGSCPSKTRLPRPPDEGVINSKKNNVTVGTSEIEQGMMLHVRQMKVTFTTVAIRDYETILGDNPSCHDGPSVGIGWGYEKERIYGIDIYDDKPIRRRGETLKLSKGEREDILLKLGYSKKQLTHAIFLRLKIKHDQQQNRLNTGIALGWDEILAGVGRKMNWFVPDLKLEES